MNLIEQNQSFTLTLSSNSNLQMVWIPPGQFQMGSPENEVGRIPEEEVLVSIKLSRGYWLAHTPTTQAQWQAIFPENPSQFVTCTTCPVETITWEQAMSYCQKLNQKYQSQLPSNYLFSLPTEAEWEYACRAGTITPYYKGANRDALDAVAWHAESSQQQTQPVGLKAPNNWGLYDMLGNVSEWCYSAPIDYPQNYVTDWRGAEEGTMRVVRGGGWLTTPDDSSIRCAGRAWVPAQTKRAWFGFRVCLHLVTDTERVYLQK